MSPIWIAVAILFSIAFTVLLCATAGFCWYLILQMRKMQASADIHARVMQEMLGDGSITRVSKALATVSSEIPEMIAAFKNLTSVMSVFSKAMMREEEAKTAPVAEGASAVYTYDETRAAKIEEMQAAQREKLDLTDEQLSVMRTDKQPPRPQVNTPTPESRLTPGAF